MNEPEERMSLLLSAAIVAAVTALCYATTLGGGFVYDDPILITQNPAVTDENVTLAEIFRSGYFGGEGGAAGFYRPVMILLFRAEYALFGEWAAGYHAVNILFHSAAAVLLFLILRRCGVPVVAAAIGALVFGIHPVNTESVAWISGGGNPVVFTLMGLSLLFLLRFIDRAAAGPPPGWRSLDLWLAIAFFVPALFVKEWALLLPAFVLLLLAIRNGSDHASASGRRIVFAAPFLMAAAVYVLVHVMVTGGEVDPDLYQGRGEPGERALTFLSVVPRYLGLLVWPAGLNLARPVMLADTILSPAVLAGTGICICFLLLIGWSLIRGHRALLLGGALPLLTLLSVSTIVPIAFTFPEMDFPFFERYLYIPCAGLGCLAAVAAGRIMQRKGARLPLLAGVAVLLVVMGLATHARNRDWRDDLSLFTRAVELYPDSPQLIASLGTAYLYEGRFEEARKRLHRASELDENFLDARVNEALALLGLGHPDEAEATLNEVLERDPRHYLALDTLGMMRVQAGEAEAALPLFSAAYENSDRDPHIGGNLYLLVQDLKMNAEELYISKKFDEALDLAERVIAAAPASWAAWAFEVKGMILLDRGSEREAVEALMTAVTVSEGSLVAARRLAGLFRARGMEAEALDMEAYIERGMKKIPRELLDERRSTGNNP